MLNFELEKNVMVSRVVFLNKLRSLSSRGCDCVTQLMY